MFKVIPESEKLPFTNSILYEVSLRLLAKQKENEIEKRKLKTDDVLKEPSEAEKKLSSYLDDKSYEKFKKIFGKIEPEDMVYNVGVNIEEYMKQIIRPQDYTKVLNPPTCLRDNVQLKGPVSVPGKGNPSSVYEFRGVGTLLPKFAYKDAHDPKYY